MPRDSTIALPELHSGELKKMLENVAVLVYLNIIFKGSIPNNADLDQTSSV